jgi:excisionase family DNA binding protein
MNQSTSPSAIAHIIGAKSPDTLTPKEAAEYLGVQVATLSIWRCTKRYPLPYIKVGRLVRYKRSDLDLFLAARTVPADGGQK